MIRQILLALFRWLIPQVESFLDPDLKARLEDLKKRTADVESAHKALDEKEAALAARLAESVEKNKVLQAKIDEINNAIDEKDVILVSLRKQRQEIDDELDKTKAAIDARADTDRIGDVLPGTSHN